MKLLRYDQFVNENKSYPKANFKDVKQNEPVKEKDDDKYDTWEDWFVDGLKGWSKGLGHQIKFKSGSSEFNPNAKLEKSQTFFKSKDGSGTFGKDGFTMNTAGDALFALAYAIYSYQQHGGNKTINVIGHTDAVGDEQSNKKLSKERAQAVADHLKSIGVTAKLNVIGMGEQKLANKDEPESSVNRRVEIKVQ